jgi:hypothetical protein
MSGKVYHCTFDLENGDELHVHTTAEGVVFDILNVESGEVVASTYLFIDEMADMCVCPDGVGYENGYD